MVALPSTTAKTGDAALIANTGAVIALGNAWGYLAKGTICTVAPNAVSWQGGTLVAISTGDRLQGGGGTVDGEPPPRIARSQPRSG